MHGNSAIGACCRNSAAILEIADAGQPRLNELNAKQAHLLRAAGDIADELLDQLRVAERWLAGMHSETFEGQATELREDHGAAWKCIDRMRSAIAKAEA